MDRANEIGRLVAMVRGQSLRLAGQVTPGMESDAGLELALKDVIDHPEHYAPLLEALQERWDELEVRFLQVDLHEAWDISPKSLRSTSTEHSDDVISLPSAAIWIEFFLENAHPEAPAGVLYARQASRTVHKGINSRGFLAPKWEQSLEMVLNSGSINAGGVYKNPHAPFHHLKGKIWDRSMGGMKNTSRPSSRTNWTRLVPPPVLTGRVSLRLVGEFDVILAMLMDGRTHHCEAMVSTGGRIRLSLKYTG